MSTLFYSMPKLLKLSEGKVDKIISLLEKHKNGKILGDSYLLHLDRLLDARATNYHKAEYVFLASFRSYADFTLLGIKYLDISYIPDIDVIKVKSNTLTSIEETKIIFKKEL